MRRLSAGMVGQLAGPTSLSPTDRFCGRATEPKSELHLEEILSFVLVFRYSNPIRLTVLNLENKDTRRGHCRPTKGTTARAPRTASRSLKAQPIETRREVSGTVQGTAAESNPALAEVSQT